MKYLASFFMVMLIFVNNAFSSVYYVDSKYGSDNNKGISEGSSFKTIQKAAIVMEPGDSCLVKEGDYSQERVVVNSSGLEKNLIQFTAVGKVLTRGFVLNGSYISVDGFDVSNNQEVGWNYGGRIEGSGIHVEGNGCEVRNMNIRSAYCIGINLFSNNRESFELKNCKIVNNKIEHAGLCGIYVTGENHLIEGNDVSHSHKNIFGDADGIRFFGKGHIFKGNYVHDIYLSENNSGAHIDCLQTWATANNILFEKNILSNPNPGNQGLMCSMISGIVGDFVFKNNIFMMYSNFRYAPAINIISGSGKFVKNIKIVNNTFVCIGGTGLYAIRLDDVENAFIANNIIYNFGTNVYSYVYLENVKDIDIQNNCVFISTGIAPARGAYDNDLWMVDPMFVDFNAKNFKVIKGSPVIDSGKELSYVSEDFDGNKRPQNRMWDIGAYEFVADNGNGGEQILAPEGLHILQGKDSE